VVVVLSLLSWLVGWLFRLLMMMVCFHCLLLTSIFRTLTLLARSRSLARARALSLYLSLALTYY
jgi:hypothetical protein